MKIKINLPLKIKGSISVKNPEEKKSTEESKKE